MLLENNPYPHDGRVRREAQTLIDAGYQVTVISPAPPGRRLSETVEGVRVFRYRAPRERDGFIGYLLEYGYAMTATFFLTLRVFMRHGFDVIHAHNPPDTFVLIALWYRMLGKKFVFDHHDLAPEMYDARFPRTAKPIVHRALLVLERLTFRTADHVIATNESYKTIALERGGLREDQVTIVRNGPEPGRVQSVPPDAELRSRAATIIGYVGELAPHDGVDYLIRALAHLVNDEERRDFHCVVIGTGTSLPGLRDLASDLGIDSFVTFTGWIPDEQLMSYLSTADICVDPDPSNPFTDRSTMIKMTEYMALGKPIVAFDLPEHRRTAQGAALYARPNEEADFAEKIIVLMDDPALRRRMSEIGLRRVEMELAWPHQQRRLLEAYERILSKPASASGVVT
jgi:glycosyltransferase involved in cell wall biosynthesis